MTGKKQTVSHPSESDIERAIELRKRSKQGQRLHPDDEQFLWDLHDKYPKWYRDTGQRIFDETHPLGMMFSSKGK